MAVHVSRYTGFHLWQKSTLIVNISNISCQKYYVSLMGKPLSTVASIFCFMYICFETNGSRFCVKLWSMFDGSFDLAAYRPNAVDPVFHSKQMTDVVLCLFLFYRCAQVAVRAFFIISQWKVWAQVFFFCIFINEPCFGRGVFHLITNQNLMI